VQGQRAPIIGNICMDMCMVDLTDLPEIQVGQVVELIGGHIPAEAVADWVGTINYEVVTRLHPNIERRMIE
jgi:alanine racemase